MSSSVNAVILAAGASSRFAPLSFERHKAFTEVRGEKLVERQIRQLQESGVSEIWIVTGYKAEQFSYLRDAFHVGLIHNGAYLSRNNQSSIWAARHVISDTYIWSSDNYFPENPFLGAPGGAWYAAQYAAGDTGEWCMTEREGRISQVTVGGRNAWYMLGPARWDQEFSRRFLRILEQEYDLPGTREKMWENILMEHLDELSMKIRRYPPGAIFEFDTLDELRGFDPSYLDNTRSVILRQIANGLQVRERDLTEITAVKGRDAAAVGFRFRCGERLFTYDYSRQHWEELKHGMETSEEKN